MKRTDVVIVPYLTHIEPDCERGLRELERMGLEVRRILSSAAIDRARSEHASTALREGADSILWIDSDIKFTGEDVERLRAHALPVVAGIYAKRGIPDLAVYLEPGTPELRVGDVGGLCEVRYIAGGFLLTQRAVYDDIRRACALPMCNARFGKPVVPYFLPLVVDDPLAKGKHWYLGEDFSFCERLRQAGHKIMVDTTIRLGHIGKYAYGWEDVAQPTTPMPGAVFHFK